jgi:hypothetical protein
VFLTVVNLLLFTKTEGLRRFKQNFGFLFIRYFVLWRCDPTRVTASSFLRFLDHTQRHIIVGRIPLDEWSASRKDLYRTTHNTHNRQTSMPSVGFKPTISEVERPQTYALDRAATGTGILYISAAQKYHKNPKFYFYSPMTWTKVFMSGTFWV